MKVKALLRSNFTIDDRINNLKISRIKKIGDEITSHAGDSFQRPCLK